MMSKKRVQDLGVALYEVSCEHGTQFPTWARCVNAISRALDANGEDFRAFLQAAGADDDEQAKGKVGL